MHSLEHLCIQLRHSPWLGQADWLWDRLRNPYTKFVTRWGHNGLERTLNGTDPLRVLPQFRGVTERYEPEVWKSLMAQIRPGDIIADVGAYIGLYSIALAGRVGPLGKLVAFEPDANNFTALEAHCRINGLLEHVTLKQVAVGDKDGAVSFEARQSSESHVKFGCENGSSVPCVRLDSVFAGSRLDVLKIDVEGYEEAVIRGARALLEDHRRKPRVIYIGVHPYAWQAVGTTSDSLLDLLASCGYNVSDLSGQPVKQVHSYGEIVAHRKHGNN